MKNAPAFNDADKVTGQALGQAIKNLQATLLQPGLPVLTVLPAAALGAAAEQLHKIFRAAAQRRKALAEVIQGFKNGFGDESPAPQKAAFAKHTARKP